MFEKVRQLGKETLLRIRPGMFWWYVRKRHGHLEPEMAFLPRLCMPDRISVDVGANYGIYSYYMLKYSKGCVAFEPFPRLAKILQQGMGRRVQVHQVALSNRSGFTQMAASLKQSGHNTIEPTNRIELKVHDPTSIVTLQVPVRTLDEFELGPVGFIKIDVEGHEQEVVAGAARTISTHLPAILIEVEEQHRSGSRHELMRWFREFGYVGLFLQNGVLRRAEYFSPERDQNPSRPADYVRNFMFLPQHRISSFQCDTVDR
jgi:FkbM family methyltransferase